MKCHIGVLIFVLCRGFIETSLATQQESKVQCKVQKFFGQKSVSEVLLEFTVRTKLSCASRCCRSYCCQAYHFYEGNNHCQLLKTAIPGNVVNTDDSVSYNRLRKAKPRECKTTTLGYDYFGHNRETISGRTCQYWNVITPHVHTATEQHFQGENLDEVENFCRNPDDEPGGPWCFTTDPSKRWESCHTPLCQC